MPTNDKSIIWWLYITVLLVVLLLLVVQDVNAWTFQPPVAVQKRRPPHRLASVTYQDIVEKAVVVLDTEVPRQNGKSDQFDTNRGFSHGKDGDPLTIMRELAATETLEGAQKAEELLMQLEDTNEGGGVVLSNKHFTVVMDAFGSIGKIDKVEALFQRMNRLVSQSGRADVAPSHVTLNVMLNAYGRQNDLDSAVSLLKESEKSGKIRCRTVDYNIVLGMLARRGDSQRIKQFLSEMTKSHNAPNIQSHNFLLESFLKANQIESKTINSMIQHLEKLKEMSLNDPYLTPNADTYAHIIQAMASQPGRHAKTALTLFEEAIATNVRPNVSLVLGMMNFYASRSDTDSARKAESLWHEYKSQLEDDDDDDDSNTQRSRVAFNTILKAFKNSATPKALKESDRILRHMQENGLADTRSYTTFLSTVAHSVCSNDSGGRSGDRKVWAIKANEILDDMWTRYKEGDEQVKPTAWTYGSVLHCWCASGDLYHAEQLLSEMEQSPDIAPTISSYATLMDGWAKSRRKNALEQIENFLDRAIDSYNRGNKECKPNQVAYSTLIYTYARSQTVESAEKAERLLREIADEYRKTLREKTQLGRKSHTDLVVPDTQLITAVMDCWQKSGSPEAGQRAEALLNWMIEMTEETGRKDMQPNAYSFASAIAAWARTSTPGKATRARKLLVQMTQMYRDGKIESPPNAYCFTSVINSCAYCLPDVTEKKCSLAIAIQTYRELLKSQTLKPTHVTFSTFLTALGNLLPSGKERTNAVRSVFEAAMERGQVDPLVVKKAQAATSSPEDLVDLIPIDWVEDGIVQVDKIPSYWSRNVT